VRFERANFSGADITHATIDRSMRDAAELAEAVESVYREVKDTDVARAIARHGEWLISGGTRGTRADFSRAALAGRDLARVALGMAVLTGCNLAGAKLGGASLAAADSDGADFSGADLAGTDLRGISLIRARFCNADLRRAQLGPLPKVGEHRIDLFANCANANFSSADLRGADFSGARLTGADFTDADLRGAALQGANLDEAQLRGALLDDAQLESLTAAL